MIALNTQPIEKPVYREDGSLEVFKVWKTVVGYEKLYKVSNFGEIKSLPRVILRKDGQLYTVRGGLLKPTKVSTGYLVVELCNNGDSKQFYIHQLVLSAFVGSCPRGMECLHSDGNPENNHVGNLAWGTPKHNADDRSRHGRTAKGERQGSAKLTEAAVVKIKRVCRVSRQSNGRLKYGVATKLARKYGVSGCPGSFSQ